MRFKILQSYWRGERSLVRSFWLAYVLGSLLVLVVVGIVAGVVGAALGISIYTTSLLVCLIILQFNPCYIFGWVAVWRASSGSRNRFAKALARAVVVAHVAVSGFFIAGVPGYLVVIDNVG